MDAVENIRDTGPVKIGIGTREHGGDLMTAGAERVFFLPEDRELILDHVGVSIRPQDVVVLVDPSLFTAKEYRVIRDGCDARVQFQIAGHAPVDLTDNAAIQLFRRTFPVGVATKVVQATGRPKGINYTVEQADAIIRLWHEVPKRKPSDIVKLADAILGLEDGTTKAHWVRDLVKKYVGTAQREKPAGWRGVRID